MTQEAEQDERGPIIRLNGSRMRRVEGLFKEFARELRFPEYFGHNWPAFDECIKDMEWMSSPSYRIVIERADELLVDDPLELGTFLKIASSAGRYWSDAIGLGPEWGGGEVRFNTVLVATNIDRRLLTAIAELDNRT